MLKSVPLFIALRYLRAKRLNRFASIVSSVSVAGIGLGVGVLLIVLSVMNGFEREVAARILGMTADITLFGSPDRMQDWRSLAARVRQHPEVRAAQAFVRGSGMLNARGKVQGVVLYGVPRDGEAEVSRLTEYLEGITLDALTNDGKPPAVILGRTLADRLSLASGDQVTLISPSWDNAQQLSLPAYDRLEVAGTFKAGMHEFDSTFGVMALEDAARLFQLGEGVSGLRIRLQDSARAPAVAAALGAELGEGYFVVDWTRFHRNFFLALESQKRIMFVVLSLIVAVAAFNVVASMVMIVKEKQRDIAILRTLGLSPRGVLAAFLIQGTLVTSAGVALGLGLGLLGAHYANDFMHLVEHTFGLQFIKPDVYYLNYLPTDVRALDALGVAVATFVLCVTATLYPAWRASRIAPVEALRYD